MSSALDEVLAFQQAYCRKNVRFHIFSAIFFPIAGGLLILVGSGDQLFIGWAVMFFLYLLVSLFVIFYIRYYIRKENEQITAKFNADPSNFVEEEIERVKKVKTSVWTVCFIAVIVVGMCSLNGFISGSDFVFGIAVGAAIYYVFLLSFVLITVPFINRHISAMKSRIGSTSEV